MTSSDTIPELVVALDALTPRGAAVGLDWDDVLRRARVPAPRTGGRLLGSKPRIAIAALVLGLLLAGIAAAGYAGYRALRDQRAPGQNGPVTIEREVGGIARISSIGPDGSLRTVWRCPTDHFCGTPRSVDWSPDGTRLAFTLWTLGLSSPLGGGVHVVDVASGRDRHLLPQCLASDVDWAPDSRRLALVTCADSLAVIGAGGAGFHVIVPAATAPGPGKGILEMSSPSWSPDGRRLVFAGLSNGRSSLYLVNADGSGLHQLVSSGAAPAWSPDDDVIAYRGPSYGSACGRLYLVTPDGVDVTTGGVSSACGGRGPGIGPKGFPAPVWSPDGTQLAVGTFTGTYVMNRDGTGIRRVNATRGVGRPAWQPARGATVAGRPMPGCGSC